MTRYGFIGTGSMGSMLVRRFVATAGVAPDAISASSKTMVSARALAGTTGITAAPSNRAVAENADLLFICVKPLVVRSVLAEIHDSIRPGTVLVSIVGCVSLEQLEEWAGDRVRCVRIIPSVTAEQDAGISLVAWGGRVRPEDKTLVLGLLNRISRAVECNEKDFDLCTDLTSCGPALIVSMVQEFSRATARTGTIPPDMADFLARETLIGTAKILAAEPISFDEIIARVATKGGTTEEGVKVLRAEMPGVMAGMLRCMDAKRQLTSDKVATEK
jgi:pyrroline-5-carboxylate reductase